MKLPPHLGFCVLPGRGHLYPAIALTRRLEQAGYHVTVFCDSIAQGLLRRSGVDHRALHFDNTRGPAVSQYQPNHNGPCTSFVVDRHASMMLAAGRNAILKEHLHLLIVDQADLASGSVAETFGLPFLNVAFFPPVYVSDDVAPFITSWMPRGDAMGRRRNRRANALLSAALRPTLDRVNAYRHNAGLAVHNDLNSFFSQELIITQLPLFLDFPRTDTFGPIVHAGPFFHDNSLPQPDFPWERLDGRPLVYASLGTVRNNLTATFELIMEACGTLDVQVVLSLGGMSLTPSSLRDIPNNCIIVHYAPQIRLLERAILCITHAGMNTVLEALTCGVPLVMLPLADDQPGVAARVTWAHCGVMLACRKLTVVALRTAIMKCLEDETIKLHVSQAQSILRGLDGRGKAVETIRNTLA